MPWSHNKELSAKNRRAWNGWVCSTLGDDARKARAEATGLTPEDLAPHSKAELTALRKKLRARLGDETAELPEPTENINFSKTYFSRFLNLEKYVFEKDADFSSATFSGYVDFSWGDNSDGNKAEHPVRFFRGADFNSTKFQSTTRFTDVQFLTAVPEFHAAEIYDDTLFPTKAGNVGNWPPLSGTVALEEQKEPVAVMDADDQKRAYNRLRLFMNRSLQIDEEQFFHRMEMRCKRETANKIHTPIYGFYEKLSDYGNSVVRPVIGVGVLIVIGAVLMLFHLEMDKPATGAQFMTAAGWSVSNTLPFLGFGKLYYGAKFAMALPVWLKVVGGVQTLFGFVFLFFLGLGLRNRFRLR